MNQMSTPVAAPPIMTERRVGLMSALLIALAPVSMSLYTPAMTTVVEAFGTDDTTVKLTMTLYFGGFAFAQLLAGPLSDAIGRRPVIFAFVGLYLVGTFMALFAPSIEVLILARFIQGLGASAGMSISRAIVRDVYDGEASSRIMNFVGIIFGLGPAFAPTIGGFLLTGFGWHSIFVFMVCIGLIVILATAFALKETVVPDRSRLNVGNQLRSYAELLRSPHFRATVTVLAGAIGAFYAHTTILPFILMGQVGMSAAEFGTGMLLQTVSYFIGSLVVNRLLKRMSAFRLVPVGLAFIILGCLGAAPLLFYPPDYWLVMIPVAVYGLGLAFAMPAMTTAALAPFPHIAGAASALMGFIQMGAGLVVGSVGAFFASPSVALAILTPVMGVVTLVGYMAFRRLPPLPIRTVPPIGSETI